MRHRAIADASTVHLMVDQYMISSVKNDQSQDLQLINGCWQEAQTLKALAQTLGKEIRLHAIINRHDPISFTAYSKADYHIHIMNGDRPEALYYLVQRALARSLPDVLVVVSDDAAFVPLCLTAKQAGRKVIVFSPSGKPPRALVQGRFDIRPLAALFANHRPLTKTIVFLDIENLLRSLCDGQDKRSPQLNLKAITDVLAKLTQVVAIHAFGDFMHLGRQFRCDVRSRLETRGIITHQTDNIRGKNCADMEIASAIHTTLDESLEITTFAIGTGDRDFRSVVERARLLGKEVVLLACSHALSRQLAELADRIIYLAHKPALHKRCVRPGCASNGEPDVS